VDNPKNRIQRTSQNAAGHTQTTDPPLKKTENSNNQYDQVIFRDWCKACGICSAFCPKGVIGRDETGAPVIEHPDACIGCRFCELHCPDFAITVKEREQKGADTSS